MSDKSILFLGIETDFPMPSGKDYANDFSLFPRIVGMQYLLIRPGIEPLREVFVIQQTEPLTPQGITIHGITDRMAQGINTTPIEAALESLLVAASQANLIVAHSMYFHTSVIKAAVRRLAVEQPEYTPMIDQFDVALDKGKRVDTMMKTIKFVGAKTPEGKSKYPTLAELYTKLHGKECPRPLLGSEVSRVQDCYNALVKLNVL